MFAPLISWLLKLRGTIPSVWCKPMSRAVAGQDAHRASP